MVVMAVQVPIADNLLSTTSGRSHAPKGLAYNLKHALTAPRVGEGGGLAALRLEASLTDTSP